MSLRFFSICFFLIFSFTVYGQKVKQKKEALTYGDGIAYYSVLKSDKSVKHGNYFEKSHPYNGSNIIVYGKYSYGKKEGLWTERYLNRLNTIKNQGLYKDGKRVGIWNFYSSRDAIIETETIVQKYNFDTNKLLMSTECDIDKDYEVFLDGKLLVAKLDCTPSFIGGIDYLNRILAKEFMLSFYLKSKSKRKSNQVFRFNSEVLKINNKFSILVKKDGTIGDLKSRGSNVNLDLIRFIEKEIKNYKNQWISGELNGEKVDAYLDLVIRLHISY